MPMPSAKQYDNDCITGMPCQQALTPIIPVRFSLTRNALENIKAGKVPAAPQDTKIGTPDYELRRLRQGYFYIYAELGMANNSTDGDDHQEGHWQIFEYYISNNDGNSAVAPEMSAEARKKIGATEDPSQKTGQTYHFRKYRWKDGTPHGEWILDNKTYPYAFVHKQVTRIHYAYSERRWAPAFFELLETNQEARKHIMQQVSLANDEPAFSLPFSKLTTDVADFTPSTIQKDEADSLTRATSIGFTERHNIAILKEEEKQRARIVAVHDPIGNLADVSALHELTWINMIRARRKYLYPTSTARAVLKLQSRLRKTWFKNYPYDVKNEETLKKYAADNFYDTIDEFKAMNQTVDNIAKVQKAMMEQAGHYSICKLLEYCAVKAIQRISQNEVEVKALNDLNMQAAILVKLAMQGIGISDQGMKYQAEMLATESIYGGYIGKIIATAQRVELTYRNHSKANGLRALKRLELELMYESLMSAQFYRWSSKTLKDKSITRESYLKAFGLTRTTVTLTNTAESITARLEQQIQGLLQDKVQIQPLIPSHPPRTMGSTSSTKNLGFTFDIIVPEGQINTQSAQQHVNMSHKMGIFLAGLSLLDTYKNLKDSQNNPWWDSVAQSTYALTGLFAMFYYERNGIAHDSIKNVLSANKSLLASLFGDQHLIVQQVDKAIRGTAYKRGFAYLGHIANFMGIVVAIADVAKGWSKHDRASTVSGILMGGAQTALFFSEMAWVGRLAPIRVASLGVGMAVSGVLMAVGWLLFSASMLYYYFSDNDAEAWVRSGFWGNSDEYWGEERVSFDKLLNESKIFAFPTNKGYQQIVSYYEKEMEGFYNLILGMSIQNDIQGDKKLRVYSPLFNAGESVNKLTIEWRQQTVWGGPGERGEQYTDLGSAKVKKKRLLANCIELDFSETPPLGIVPKPDWRNLGRTVLATQGILTLKYPKLGSSTEHFIVQRIFGKNEI
ncbi:toxin VasX [Rodentibacter myodis]|uniref:Toxin VasX N-terminal region domain-containing protein n=1 Tax=Rodentibacter myodis TaxID=1907939 RepID=A0A1V3JSR3_9PAST|nr:toxin VasX [Rodentibacter myodis]OOF59461.1 hypothetical protein BKL49_03160 [Rodentibacter myodis]